MRCLTLNRGKNAAARQRVNNESGSSGGGGSPVAGGGGSSRKASASSRRNNRSGNYVQTKIIKHRPPPPPQQPANMQSHHQQKPLADHFSWYAGEMDRNEAENILTGKPTGTFLVRVKENHSYAISLVFNNATKHIRLLRSKDNLYYLAECKNFRSVQELVGYYEDNIMSTSFLGLETTLKYPAFGLTPTSPQPPTPVINNYSPMTMSARRTSNHLMSNSSSSGGSGGVSYGKALYDFQPRTESELGLKQGQLVTIVSKKGDSHGWWKVTCEGKTGYVPASFVEELT